MDAAVVVVVLCRGGNDREQNRTGLVGSLGL